MDLLGFCGTFCAGKDQAANYLVSLGWNHVSTSDVLRELAREAGIPPEDRDRLREFSNQARRERGNGFLIEIAAAKPRPVVMSGIRAVGEAETLSAIGGVLIAFDAPVGLRYRRASSRGRNDLVKSLEEFMAQERAESQSDDPGVQNIPAVMKMAAKRIWNCYSHDEWMRQELDRLLKQGASL